MGAVDAYVTRPLCLFYFKWDVVKLYDVVKFIKYCVRVLSSISFLHIFL